MTFSTTPPLTIGKLSRLSRCNVETIRYYERIGLMPEPPRTPGGHRLYGQDHVRRLAAIRRCRELGFSLEDVRELLGLADAGRYTCEEVRDIGARHLRAVRDELESLRALERVLDGMVAECSGDTAPDCPLLDALFASPGASR